MKTVTNVWETIPTESPPIWAKNPHGWRKHQLLLVQFCKALEKLGIQVKLPKEVPGQKHDNGIDLLVGPNEIAFDLKSFWLRKDYKTRTWDSPVHRKTEGRKAFYTGKVTEQYIHADPEVPVSQWLVCRAAGLRRSYFPNRAPFYYHKDIQTLNSWLETNFT